MTHISSWYDVQFDVLTVVVVEEGERQFNGLLGFLSAGNFEYFWLLLTSEDYFCF